MWALEMLSIYPVSLKFQYHDGTNHHYIFLLLDNWSKTWINFKNCDTKETLNLNNEQAAST